MKIELSQGNLCIDNGSGGNCRLPVSDILAWSLVATENGAVYFAFDFKTCTQHVSVVTGDSVELERDIEELTELLGEVPSLDLRNNKLPHNFNKYSGVIAGELLFVLLAFSSGC